MEKGFIKIEDVLINPKACNKIRRSARHSDEYINEKGEKTVDATYCIEFYFSDRIMHIVEFKDKEQRDFIYQFLSESISDW